MAETHKNGGSTMKRSTAIPLTLLLWLALLALCISLSTVFMKQHSILDVLCALPVCALGWWLCYGRPGRHG